MKRLYEIDWVKVGKGALIAAVGAGLTYLTQWGTATDFGDLTPIVVALFSVLTNYFRKVAGSEAE